jgi:hypothetical protein
MESAAGGEPCGEPAISLHSHHVSLVQWSTRLLPVTRDPGSKPLGGLMWNWDSPVSIVPPHISLIDTCHVFIVHYTVVLSFRYTGRVLLIHHYTFLIQIMYFNTVIHIYQQICMFLKKPTVTEWSVNGDTLVYSLQTQTHNLTPTLLLTFSSTMVSG